MWKRMICLALCLACAMAWHTVQAAEGQTIYELLDEASVANEACKNSDEQIAVGALYLLKTTEIAVRSMPGGDALTERLDALLMQYEADEKQCRNADQHAANRLYAVADLAALAAARMDAAGAHTARIQEQLARLNEKQKSAAEQQALAAEVLLQLLVMIAEDCDPAQRQAETLAGVMQDYEASRKICRGP